MSLAIWINYRLADSSIVSDEVDKYQLIEYMEDLDTLCDELQITHLSSFVNASEALNMLAEENLHDDEEGDFNELRDFADEFTEDQWHSPREFIFVVDSLYEYLYQHPEQLQTTAKNQQELLKELEQCLAFAQEALEQSSDQLHLVLLL